MNWYRNAKGIEIESSTGMHLDFARLMLKRMLKDGSLMQNGIKFNDCDIFRYWRSEIDLEGLAIVPELGKPFNRRDFLRQKFLAIDPSIVKEIVNLLASEEQ